MFFKFSAFFFVYQCILPKLKFLHTLNTVSSKINLLSRQITGLFMALKKIKSGIDLYHKSFKINEALESAAFILKN